jgi:predicted acylesterase/phospholipase RssA
MIKNLILSGGAFRSCSHIGCIRFLEERNIIKSIVTFIGTSAGSLVCFCLCLGMSSLEIENAIIDFIDMQNECQPNIDNIINIYYTMGVNDGEILDKFIEKYLYKKYQKRNITFVDFAKATGKNLVVYASKLPNLETTYFSVDTSPELDVAKAIRASCALPLIFIPVQIGSELYIDPGLVNNFPFDYVQNNRLKDTLGINLYGKLQTFPEKIDLGKFVMFILDALMKRANESSRGQTPDCLKIIKIVQEESDGFELNFDLISCKFDIPREKIKAFIDNGYNAISNQYDSM